MEFIELSGINRFFGPKTNRVQVLKNISLSIKKGDFVAIIGQSGSGKSTLMNILGCLDAPTSGSYQLAGEETTTMDTDQRAILRRQKIGFIFQQYNLISSMNAAENVTLPAIYIGASRRQRLRRAQSLLADLGLRDKFEHKPTELSGGQQQRVSIARALMNGGEIILADEPTGALDSESGRMVMHILQDLHARGHTIILVTHDAQIASFASRVIEIKDGEILSDSRKMPYFQKQASSSHTDLSPTAWQGKDQFLESAKMSIQAIFAHKLRSFLTMLGIIIGIAAVVSVVALGKGSQEKILNEIRGIGTNTITVYPGKGWGDVRSGRIKTLTVEDAMVLAQQSYVKNVTPLTFSSGILAYRNTTLTARLSGVGSHYFAVESLEVRKGRLLNAQDIAESRQVVVIDHNTKEQLFPQKNEEEILGRTLFFQKRPLMVIGIVQEKENAFGSANSNLRLWAPYTTVMQQITGNRHISSIIIQIADTVNSQAAEQSITHLLISRHGSEDFFTSNSDSIQKTIRSTTDTMTLMVSSIAFIALAVGGIGVMNIMLVSVTERTREIGVRMAIGAQRINILQQFLIEAALICLVGGLIGVLLSLFIAYVFNAFVTQFAMSFSPYAIVMAVVCSTAIGLIFGFIPARNAAQLNPIDALSRE